MAENYTEVENLYGLIVLQPGKPQQVLKSYLRMILNFQYGLDIIVAHNIVAGYSIIQKNPQNIVCAFIVQDEEIDSKTAIATLNQQGQIPLLLLVPKGLVEAHQTLCAHRPNVSVGSWERAFDGSSASIKGIVKTTFEANHIDVLLNGEEGVSYQDLQKKVARRIRNLDTLPTLPQVVLQIMKLIEDPRATIDDMENAISSDPSIVWKLLEVIKVPVFAGTRRREWTLREIIVRLGMRKVGAIAQQIKLMNNFVSPEESLFSLRRFWEHSLGCAMVADRLYTQRLVPIEDRIEFDEYWIGALLHDIGKLVLGVFFSRHFQHVLAHTSSGREVVRDFHQTEVALGYAGLHKDVTRLLLLKANVGPRLVKAVGAHHTGGKAPDGLVCLLHMADNLSKDLGFGCVATERGEYSESVLQKLGLTLEGVNEIKASLGDSMAAEIKDVVHRSTMQKVKKTRQEQEPGRGTEERSGVPIESREPSPAPATSARYERDKSALLSEILNQIKERLRAFPALTRNQKEDFLVDVEAIRAQIRKNVPNETILLTLLEGLSAVECCGDLITRIEVILSEELSVERV